jgi:hypothetical protein
MVRFFRNLSYVLASIITPTLVYFTSKFYVNKSLAFEEAYFPVWTILVIMISFSLVLSCFALRQNKELKDLILDLKSQSENNHYENMGYMQNTRELFMDSED